MDPFPIIGVCATPKITGANTVGDGAPLLTCLPFDQAIAREWPSDAHLVTYDAVNQESWPRCNKSVLGPFRAMGGDLRSRLIAIDIDLPGHSKGNARWTPSMYERFCEVLLGAAAEGNALCGNWTTFYTTRAGARLMYVLQHPVPVDEIEPYIRGIYGVLAPVFEPLGYEMPPLADWGRIFRLPRVVREGVALWAEAYFECLMQPENRLSLNKVKPLGRLTPRIHEEFGPVTPLAIPMPEPAAALELLREVNSKGSQVLTKWARSAQARLRGLDCYPCLFEGKRIAPQGQRHVTIFKYVGTVCRRLYGLEGSSPELVFALFSAAAFLEDPSSCRRPPHETVWDAVLICWAGEEARNKAAQAREAVSVAGRTSAQLEVLAGMRKWCDIPELHGSDEASISWMDGKLIACRNDTRFVMRRDGFYDSLGVPLSLLPARIRELGMDSVIPLMRSDPKSGSVVEVAPGSIVARHGTVVSSIEGVVGSEGTIISHIGTEQARLVVRLFGLRKDLEPRYEAEVDQWLNVLGGEHYTKLCEWLGHALDFTGGPICALSIDGPPGSGKGMLIQGLSECVDTEVYADGTEFGNHQELLKRSPFLVVNEGFPSATSGTRDIPDTFRALVDGSATNVNAKYQALMTIRNPMRIIIAANNDDVVSSLAGSRDLTAADRLALALRLFHIKTGDEAERYLRWKGGYSHTAQHGRRWVRGADGAASDYVVARHLMHLFVNRPPVPKGNRFLMEGSFDAEIMRKFGMRGGSGPEVVETLVAMIESKTARIDGFSIEGGRIFVTSHAIVDHHRILSSNRRNRELGHKSVSKVLDSMLVAGSTVTPSTHGSKADSSPDRRRWRQIDPIRLLEDALEYGMRCEKLKAIVQNGVTAAAIGAPREFL